MDFQLRKERTDNLVDGLRRVRTQSFSPSGRLSDKAEVQPVVDKKGERLRTEDQLDRDIKPKALREEVAELVEGIHRDWRARSGKAVCDDHEPPPPTIETRQDEDTDEGGGDGAIGFPR